MASVGVVLYYIDEKSQFLHCAYDASISMMSDLVPQVARHGVIDS